MRAYYVSNYTAHPKLILENNSVIDLFDNTTENLIAAINTIIETYGVNEIVVSNDMNFQLIKELNTAYNYSGKTPIKITMYGE